MTKKILFTFIFSLLLLFSVSLVKAQQFDNLIALPPDEEQQRLIDETYEEDGQVLGLEQGLENTAPSEDEDIVISKRGPHFFFGEDVTIDEDLIGDVFAAGSRVVVNGMIDGDLMVAGGMVTINGNVSDDVRVAAGELTINGLIGGNLTAGAGTVDFDSSAKVGNSMIVGAGNISLDGEVIGNVFLGGGATKLAGKFGADVHAQADTFEVMPGVVVAGSLIADAQTKADIADGAQVGGERMVTVTTKEEKKARDKGSEKMESFGGVLVKATLVGFMVKLLMGLVSGGILLYFLPKLAGQLSTKLIVSPLASLGWGFVYLMLTPLVILLTMLTVVGLPLSMVLILLYGLSLAVAGWIAAYAVGHKLHEVLKLKTKSKFLIFALGLTSLNLIGLVPVVGWAVQFIAFLMGFGAIFILVKTKILSRSK